jgi:hypothetical protein
MSTLSEEVGQIKLISYKGIPTQLKDDEICLKEIKKDKAVSVLKYLKKKTNLKIQFKIKGWF